MTMGQFRNDAARLRFLSAYDTVLDRLWPGPRTAVDAPTAFGTTRVYRSGSGSPIVLLPGAGGNSLMWHRYVPALGAHHEVITVDPIGEPGASVQQAPIRDGHDGAAWLDQLLTALDVTSAHVVGCSYGGWLALNHAIDTPDRISSLTLLDPAGFADPGPRFYRWMITGALAGLAPRLLRPRLARLVTNHTVLEHELMSLALPSAAFRRRLPPATLFTDHDLHRLRTPAQFLLGARSALHDARQVADRLADRAPDTLVEIVPDAGHALPMDRPELVTDRILRFTTA
ncbi:alpha/beta fold hydrolase [Kitasatospora sp. NPDC101801]|uniref:alpha/beta fold hydrolase n=1 Tax=Kitasatospora sp. NPDC101801 TaxID=3364103 RepID=UPI00381960A0